MNKMAYLFLLFVAAIGLVACNQQQVVDEKPSTSEPKPSVSEPKGEDPTTPSQPVPNEPEEQVYQNDVFKDVIVTNADDEIIVTGKAQVFEGVFQYALYDGEKVVKESNYQTDGAPAWGEFEIKLAKELITTNHAKFELFVYSAKDGSKINTLDIPIPKP